MIRGRGGDEKGDKAVDANRNNQGKSRSPTGGKYPARKKRSLPLEQAYKKEE
jgi:hypothetical protein